MTDLEIDIPRLYRAGKLDIPAEASRMSEIAYDLFGVLGTFNTMSAGAGDPAAWRKMLRVGGEIYDQVRETVDDLNNVGVAVIKTADDLRQTEDGAEEQFLAMGQHLKDLDPPPAPRPPDIGDVEAPGGNHEDGSRVESTPEPSDPEEVWGVRRS